MLRLLGFVTGAALTVVVMLAMAGDWGPDARETFRSWRDEARTTETPGSEVAEVDDRAAASAENDLFSTRGALQAIAAAERPPQADPLRTDQSSSGTPAEFDETPDPDPIPVNTRDTPDPDPVPTDSATVPSYAGPGEDTGPGPKEEPGGGWYVFWTPFRSEASASGFAARLGRDTGRDYRVIRAGPGEYRVALFHADDHDLRTHLLEIEQVSGLTLGGGEL